MKEQPEQRPEFDNYAENYAALIRDPIRDKFASGSQFFFQRKIDIIREFFRRNSIETEKLSWLDIGCGQGDLLRLGRPHFKSVAGCDPSDGMLQACEGLEVRHQESIDKLPFADRTFDFVTSVCVYHHVPIDRRAALSAETARVLRPGGTFCIIEHNPWNPVTKLIVSRTPVDADAILLNAVETRRLLSGAGCKIAGTYFFLYCPERVYRLTRGFENALSALPLGGQYAVFSRLLPG